MTTHSYERVRADFETLEKYDEVSDEVELDSERRNLMNNPTKKVAADLFRRAISLWLYENFDKHSEVAEVVAIRKRYTDV
jgi:hypothetical protein